MLEGMDTHCIDMVFMQIAGNLGRVTGYENELGLMEINKLNQELFIVLCFTWKLSGIDDGGIAWLKR